MGPRNKARSVPFEPTLRQVGNSDDAGRRPIVQDADGNLWRFDLTYRQLAVHELAAGQGFPRAYAFAGSTADAKRMIGNAVPVGLADCVVTAALYNVESNPMAA